MIDACYNFAWHFKGYNQMNTPKQGPIENLTINTYHAMGRFSRWQFGDIFLIFPRNRIWHFMQTLS